MADVIVWWCRVGAVLEHNGYAKKEQETSGKKDHDDTVDSADFYHDRIDKGKFHTSLPHCAGCSFGIWHTLQFMPSPHYTCEGNSPFYTYLRASSEISSARLFVCPPYLHKNVMGTLSRSDQCSQLIDYGGNLTYFR